MSGKKSPLPEARPSVLISASSAPEGVSVDSQSAAFSQGEKGIRLDLRQSGRMLTGATEPAMPTDPKKPLIVISYAHEDEPATPAEGEAKWLSFVTGYLRPAVKHGAVDLWLAGRRGNCARFFRSGSRCLGTV
jgi:hypothetical protein